jgi:nitrate reductase NapE
MSELHAGVQGRPDADAVRTQRPYAHPAVAQEDATPLTKRDEWRSFLFLTVVMAPVLAAIIVAGYGFVVWMSQLISGPPGPPTAG